VAAPARQIRRIIGVLLKLTVTGLCFWYVGRSINLDEVLRAAKGLEIGWFGFALVLIVLQIPLVGLRWRKVVDAIGADVPSSASMIAITAICTFFAQVLPQLVGDTMRVGMLARLDVDWRKALASVLIDRGVGIAVLMAIGFLTLLFPSALTALGGHRALATEIFGAILAAGLIGLFLVPYVAPILQRRRVTRWLGELAGAAHHVLLRSRNGPSIVGLAVAGQALTIMVIWSLAQAQGILLPVTDSAVLFTVMVAVSVVPISAGGWGVRELAVTSLLGSHGFPAEQALFFSVCFGLALLNGSLPGAVVWAASWPQRAVKAVDAGR